MTMNQTEFQIILLIVGIGSTVVIAYFFKIFWKSKIEIVFENNINYEVRKIMGRLEGVNHIVRGFYFVLEEEVGLLTPNRTDLDFTNTRSDLLYILGKKLDEIEKNFRLFEKGKRNYQQYLDVDFLYNVREYYLTTIGYLGKLEDGYHDASVGLERITYVKYMYEFIQKNNIKDSVSRPIGKFFDEWKKREYLN